MNRVIPQHLEEAFKEHLEGFDDDSLRHDRWWAKLEEGAEDFLKTHKLINDPTLAVYQYLELQGIHNV